MAKKYYDRLFKEYVLADLSRYVSRPTGSSERDSQQIIVAVWAGGLLLAEGGGGSQWEGAIYMW
jgi:hypothetical protein